MKKKRQSSFKELRPLYEFRGPWWMRIRLLRKLTVLAIENYYQIRERAALVAMWVLRISTIKECVRPEFSGNKFAIFATYPGQEMNGCHVRFVKKIMDRGYHVIVVSNKWKSSSEIQNLFGSSCTYIFRRPYGRDFGCYMDAMKLIYANHKNGLCSIDRVLLFNDSVITFERTEASILDHLDDGLKPFVGIGENFEFNHHVGSYMLAFSGEIAKAKRMRRYWRRYTPVSTRRHSIHAGEMGLSRTISRLGYSAYILLNTDLMREWLDSRTIEDLAEIYSMMPEAFAKEFSGILNVFDASIDRVINLDETQASASALLQLGFGGAAGLDPRALAVSENFELRRVSYREKLAAISEDFQRDVAMLDAKRAATEALLRFVFRGSQIHSGCILILYMGGYLLKKDVIFRQMVNPYRLTQILESSGAVSSTAEAKNIYHDVIAKGHPYSLSGNKRILYMLGFI